MIEFLYLTPALLKQKQLEIFLTLLIITIFDNNKDKNSDRARSFNSIFCY